LTAKAPPKICHFLYATGCEIFIAFDNDEGGRSATKKILEVVSKYPKAAKKFHILNYPYQDPNHCLMKIGPGKFVDKIKFQLPLAGI
jgi:DNA primase